MALTVSQIQNAYVTFFNRPADVAGMNYWSSYAGSSTDLLNTFALSSEYTSLYTGLVNSEIVETIYGNLFGRTGDDIDLAGLSYWVGKLDSGALKIGNIADAINKGAQGSDAKAVANKTTAATSFTIALDTTSEAIAYAAISDSGLAVVKTWLTSVTTDASLVTAAGTTGIAAITAAVLEAEEEEEEEEEEGLTFTLSAESDDLLGDSDDNTFNAAVGNLDDDVLDGAEGDDTLVAYINAAVTPVISNIETIDLISRNAAASLDMTDVSDVDTINASGNNDLAIIEIDAEAAPIISISDFSDTLTLTLVDAEGETDTLTLAVNGMSGEVDVTNAVEIIALSASGEASVFTYEDDAAALETFTVSGAGDVNVTFTTTDASFVEFNAAESTGDVTMTVSVASAMAATGGAGDDTFEFGTTLTIADTVVGGDGEDTVTFTIASTSTVRPTISEVEVVEATFTAAGTLNLVDSDTVTTVEVGGSTAAMDITNASAEFTDVTVSDDADFALDVDYASNVEGALTITIGDSDDGEGASVDVAAITTDATSLTIASIGDDENSTAAITADSALSLTFTTDSSDSDLTVANIDAEDAATITITATGGDIELGTLASAIALTTLVMTATGEGSITVGAIGGTDEALALTDITATLVAGSLTMGQITVSDAEDTALSSVDITSAGESIQLGAGATFVVGDGAAGLTNLDDFTITATGDDLDLDVGDVQVDNIDEITLTLSGEDGNALFDLFDVAVDIGDITIELGNSYTAVFTDIDADSDIGNIEITTAEDGTLTLTDVDAGGNIGDLDVTVGDNGTFILTNLESAGSMGDLTIAAGKGATITITDMDVVGALGSITLTGEDADFDITLTDGTAVGDIDASGTDSDSTVDIDVALLESAVTITLGAGTNVYSISQFADSITLGASTGNDTVTLGFDGNVTIANFDVEDDSIMIDLTNVMADTVATGDVAVLGDGANVANAATGSLALLSATATISASTANILVIDTDDYTTTALLETALEVGGDDVLVSDLADLQVLMLIFSDGTDSYLATLSHEETVNDTDFEAGDLTIEIIATFTGITDVTTFANGNFDFQT